MQSKGYKVCNLMSHPNTQMGGKDAQCAAGWKHASTQIKDLQLPGGSQGRCC